MAQQLYDIKVGALARGEHAHDEVPIRRRRRKNGNIKPMRFVSLHHHSTFSYKDGFQMPEAHVRRAEELQMSALAMTEHGNVSSHVKFEIAADKVPGIKPIFGCEVYTGKVGEGATQSKYHLTILAKDQTGYSSLMALVSQAWSEGFYYEPTVSWEMLNAHKRGLFILSGCTGSLLFCSAVGGKLIKPEDASPRRALEVARRFRAAFGRNYFIEVQAFPELEQTRKGNPILASIARKLRIPLVATQDCHYTELEDNEVQQILHNLRGGNKKSIEEQAREWGYDVPLCPPPNDMSIYRRLRQTGLSKSEAVEAIISTEEIAQECNVVLPKLPMVRFQVPAGFKDAQEYWEHCLREGWKYRDFGKLPLADRIAAKKQIAKERRIIESKDFVDYFLIIRQGVIFVKDTLKAPVGPARGSAAASLCAYLLRITEVNPMKFPLLVFERFIDITRDDLPDIDLDFPSEVRPALRDYYESIYGHAYNIGTFTYFKSKLALDDVARVFRIPKFKVEEVKNFLIERSSGDLRASSTIEDTVAQFEQPRKVFEEFPDLRKSALLEGNVKGFGVHAAGLAVSNRSVMDNGVAAMYERENPKGSGNFIQVLSLDKYDAERQGLVKMDFLGLSTMSVIWDCIRYLDMHIDDLYQLPLDDKKVFDAFRANDVVGIFQFDGRAMRYVCGSLKPDNFAEICDCNALARPGPLHNGAAREYAEIKHGNRNPERVHPAVDSITAPTQFQIVYQEQILKIVREVGDFPWTHAAEIRKIIALKKGEAKFNESWDDFLRGSRTVHKRLGTPPMTEGVARDVWANMITAGSYAFNAAHCVAYGYLAYFTMWFKVHHPEVFYAFSLAHTDSNNKPRVHDLVRDAAKHGVKILKPHPGRSSQKWEPAGSNGKFKGQARIRAGFIQVHGIGEKMADQIVEYRSERGGLESWDDLTAIKGIGPKTVEKITEWVRQEDPFGAYTLDKNITKVKHALERSELGDNLPLPTHTATDLPFEQGVEFEVVWLGTFNVRNIRDIFEVNRAKGQELDPAKTKDPHLNEWAQLVCEDETDQLLLKIDRWKYPKFKNAIFDFRMGHDLLLVEGVRPRYVSARQVKVKKLWVIDPDD